MYTLDASVVGRDFDPGDPEYGACHELIAQLDEQAIPVNVPRLLLAEVAGLVRRLTRDPIRARVAVDAWRTFQHVQIVPLDDALIDTAAEIAADYALRGVDATHVAVARRHIGKPRTERLVVGAPKPNNTGVVGVRRRKENGTEYYEATWVVETGKSGRTRFSIAKHGEKGALKQAIKARQSHERERWLTKTQRMRIDRRGHDSSR